MTGEGAPSAGGNGSAGADAATEEGCGTGPTFEDIDWSAVESPSPVSARAIVRLALVTLVGGAALYDGVTGGALAPSLGVDPTGVDYLFVLVVGLIAVDALLPLARNRRVARHYWRRFRRNRAAVASLYYLAALFLVAVVGPPVVEVTAGPPTIHLGEAYRPPVGMTAAPAGEPVTGTWAHPLGTDHEGRDVLKLLVYGARVSLEVGLVSAFVAVSLATVVGTTAAYLGGVADELLMRYVDLQQTFPAFLLLVFLVYLYGQSLLLIVLLFGALSWGSIARLVRSEALQRREEGYVLAAESAGAGRWWIIRRHLIPNVSGTAITAATLVVPYAILGEASLSFIGLGDSNVHSWGRLVAAGRDALAGAPWIATVPGVALFGTVLAFNFVGDALRDALDPGEGGRR